MIAGSDVLVQPSVLAANGDMDGIPNTLIEAMALGIPVVTTAVSGIPELVIDGVTGVVVEPGDPEDLAAGLQRVIEDPEAARKRAAGGLAKVSAEFDIADSAAAMASLLSASWSGTDRRAVGPAARTLAPRRPSSSGRGSGRISIMPRVVSAASTNADGQPADRHPGGSAAGRDLLGDSTEGHRRARTAVDSGVASGDPQRGCGRRGDDGEGRGQVRDLAPGRRLGPAVCCGSRSAVRGDSVERRDGRRHARAS